MARLAIAKGFLGEYAKLDQGVQRAVDAAIAAFARNAHPGQQLELPRHSRNDRIRLMPVDTRWRGVVLAPATPPTGAPVDRASAARETYCLVTVLPQDKVDAYVAGRRFSVNRARGVLEVHDDPGTEANTPTGQETGPAAGPAAGREAWPEAETQDTQIAFVSGPEELQRILAHPFAAWLTFLHPNQRDLAYQPSYAGPAQVTGGPGTGKTVTVLHRAALLAERTLPPEPTNPTDPTNPKDPKDPTEPPLLLTTFNGNLAHALAAQLDLLVPDVRVRQQIEVLNVDRLAYRVVRQSRGTPVIADEREVRDRWAKAVADAGLEFTPAFGKNEWEQVILAQDLRTEQAYLTCLRTGRGRPLTKPQRGQVWRAAEQVTAELAAARRSTHLQLADEASELLRQPGAQRYRHILVDEAQDLHPSQWRLLRAAVPPGPDDLFIAADPHQRVYQNRVSLGSLRISVRGRSRRLSLNYRTTQEILAWAVPLLGTEPVTGLDDEVDSLLGYRSPRHGPRPERRVTTARSEEFHFLAERLRAWLATGIEPPAVGVAARSAGLVREARQALAAEGIATVSLSGRANTKAVRVGTMHAMKGLEFQAVAVIGVEQGLVPAPELVTSVTEDAAAHAQDLQRERCVLFVACTRARDHLYVSGTGEPSPFLPPGPSSSLTPPPYSAPPPSPYSAPPPSPYSAPAPAPALASAPALTPTSAPAADSTSPSTVAPAEPDRALDQILPAASLGRLFRLLLACRVLDPGMDAESFLAWATAPGRRLRLAGLDGSARRFLLEAGEQALDLADRCLDLLDRLAAHDPDLSGPRLPKSFIDAARTQLAAQPPTHPAPRRPQPPPPRPYLSLDPATPALNLILPPIAPAPARPAPDAVTTWQVTVDGDPVTVRSRAGAPPAAYPLTMPVRTVRARLAGATLAGAVSGGATLAGADYVTELEVVSSSDPVLFFAADGRHLPARLPLPPGPLWVLRPAGRELVVAGELRTIRESPVPSGWDGWHLELVSLEQASSVGLRGGPAHAVPQDPRPRLLLGEPLPGVTAPDGSPVYQEPPQLWLPDAVRWHVAIRPAPGGLSLVSREFTEPGPADIWDGVPRPILGAFGISVRGPLGRSLRQTIYLAQTPAAPAQPQPSLQSHQSPQSPPHPSAQPETLASGAEISAGQLTIRDIAQADGLTAGLYLARAPWRAPVIVPVPADGVVELPPSVREAGPLLVQLRAEDPRTVTNWPGWPGRAAYTCMAPGIPDCVDQEEEALCRFLAGQRDLPMRPRQVDRLWRLLRLAADLIAAGAPADLRTRCSAVLRNQPGLAMTGLLDSGLDAGACVAALISTGLAVARPVMMDDMVAAERLWDLVPAAAAVLSSRLLAGPACPDEDPAAVVVEAALARCGPSLDAMLCGADDPHAQVGRFGPDDERMAAADPFAPGPPAMGRLPAAVVPQPLLDADTRAVAAARLFAARRTPELTRAAHDAGSVVRAAERLVAATPYRRAAAQIAARRHPGGKDGWLALPAMSASLALVARISARGHQDCRSFEQSWRPRWTDLARQAPDLTSIDLVLAEALVAAAERARFS